jgi:hypothetical protein
VAQGAYRLQEKTRPGEVQPSNEPRSTPDARPAPLTMGRLLPSGGDSRILLDETTGLNRYSCQPFPDEAARAFGSSTASVISVPAYAAGERLAKHLNVSLAQGADAADLYAQEMDRIRQALLTLLGLHDLPGLGVIIGPSGTDLHRIMAQLAGLGTNAPPLVIACESAETGSTVGDALGGHASAGSSLRGHISVLQRPDAAQPCQILQAPSRTPDGEPRPPQEVDQEVMAVASAAATLGRRVVLVLMDVSKTGLISPSIDCALELKRRFPEQLEVLVDACQMRIGPATLRAYLEADFLVAVTGSKFMTGPTFSAALLAPEGARRRLGAQRLPVALAAHSMRADWPADWPGVGALPAAANFGLALRWQAALEEIAPFLALPQDQVHAFFQAFAMATTDHLNHDPAFEPLAQRPLDRVALGAPLGWDAVQTIHPFLLIGPSGPIAPQDALGLHRLMGMDLGGWARAVGESPAHQACAHERVQLGQPVSCGQRDGRPLSALRLCASARLAVDALGPGGLGPQAVIDDALKALDKAAWLCRRVTSAA